MSWARGFQHRLAGCWRLQTWGLYVLLHMLCQGCGDLPSVALMCYTTVDPRAFELPVPSPECLASGKGRLLEVEEGRN